MMNGRQQQDSIQVIREKSSAEILLSFQQSQIDYLFTQLIHKPWGYACWQPFIDVLETSDAYTIIMDVPGVDAQAVRVHLADSKITVEGQRDLPETLRSARLCCSERPRGMFLRTIDISQPVNTEISTTYEQGVLTIHLKKLQTDGDAV